MIEYLYGLDSGFLIWIQQTFIHDFLTPIMLFITKLGNSGKIWICLSLFLCLPRKTRKTGILCLLALLGSVLINNMILKNLVARTRPYDAIEQVKLLVRAQKDYSFPSGHAGSSFAAASVIFFRMKKRYGVPCLILAMLIGFSRWYVGVHYPSDVLVGALIGMTIGYFIVKVGDRKRI